MSSIKDFVNQPLQKRLNQRNILSRLERVEDVTGVGPSASIGSLAELSQATGDLIVFGTLAIPDRDDGTNKIAIDDTGITFSNTAGVLYFKNASGAANIQLYGSVNNDFLLQNDNVGGGIRLDIELSDASSPSLRYFEYPASSGIAQLEIPPGGSGGRVAFGSDHFIDYFSTTDTAGSKRAYFNERNLDIDFSVEGVTDASLFYVDAGLDAIGIGGAAESGYKFKVTGAVKFTDQRIFSAYLSANQNINDVTFTKVQFNTEEFDVGANYDNATNYRYTPTTAGKYQVNACVSMASAGGQMIAMIYKNGARFKDGTTLANTALGVSSVVSALVDMNGSTDYLEIFVYQNSGGVNTATGGATATYFQASLQR